eukprot:TRINITY_DN6967_c0_g2_i4.p1 TRINITY_DN6967_c0_g2~~TRINITY_DN6967_c0_g2_i4.p1  ORF type:complete len:278 (+),score=77.11 TRINITY_DN6967_c0_g2_i4:59-892(+)
MATTPKLGGDAAAQVADAEQALIQLGLKNPNMFDSDALQAALASFSAEAQIAAINSLLRKGKLSIFEVNGSYSYKLRSEEESSGFLGLAPEEMLIYQLISASGNMGLWTKDMRIKSNLQQQQITKILKNLENRKLVKSVKSISGKNKKVYMLANIEPSREVTGGAWYNDQEFDREFANILYEQCLQYIQLQTQASTADICNYVKSSGIFKIEVTIEDIQSMIDTLVYDGVVVQTVDHSSSSFLGGKTVYRAAKESTATNPFTEMPCGVCPVRTPLSL